MKSASFFRLNLDQKRQVLRYAELAFKKQNTPSSAGSEEMTALEKSLGFSRDQILAMAKEKIAPEA